MKSFFKSRYSIINLSIFVFALIVVSVMALTIYYARQSNLSSLTNSKAQQLNIMVQTMSRDVFGMKMRYGETPFSPRSQISLKRLRAHSAEFSAIIQAFQQGGDLPNNLGEQVRINALTNPEDKALIDELANKWKNIKPIIDDYANTAEDLNFDKTKLDIASSTLINVSSTDFPNLTAKLAKNINERNQKQSDLLELVLLAVIAFAIVYFLVFVFFFVRRLKQADRQAEKSQRETSDIMRTVHEGLFLINPDFSIGHQFSASLARMFPHTEIANKTVEELIAPIVSEHDLSTAKMYIEQLFNHNVVEKLIADLNPLSNVTAILKDDAGVATKHFLQFSFSRVYDGDKVARVLVSVDDITRSVLLDQALEKQKEQNDENMALLLSILQVDHGEFQQFFQHAQHSIAAINHTLRDSEHDNKKLTHVEYLGKLDQIFRETHSLKGEASALGLSAYVSSLEEMEERISKLKREKKLDGKQFLGLAIVLETLIQTNNRIEQVENIMTQWQSSHSDNNQESGTAHKTHTLGTTLERFASDIAERNGRRVALSYYGFDANALHPEQASIVKDLSIQLLRNAIVHGIEAPAVRKERNKPDCGRVSVNLREENDYLYLKVEDDGNGIDFDALRQKAIQHPNFKAVNPQEITEKALMLFMLESGVSTKQEANEDAGRGVGSDVIVDRVRQLQGKLSIKSEKGQFTHFVVKFPKKADE